MSEDSGELKRETGITSNRAKGRDGNWRARMASDGRRVVLLDIDEETLNRSAAALPDANDHLAICCDVADALSLLPLESGSMRPPQGPSIQPWRRRSTRVRPGSNFRRMHAHQRRRNWCGTTY